MDHLRLGWKWPLRSRPGREQSCTRRRGARRSRASRGACSRPRARAPGRRRRRLHHAHSGGVQGNGDWRAAGDPLGGLASLVRILPEWTLGEVRSTRSFRPIASCLAPGSSWVTAGFRARCPSGLSGDCQVSSCLEWGADHAPPRTPRAHRHFVPDELPFSAGEGRSGSATARLLVLRLHVTDASANY